MSRSSQIGRWAPDVVSKVDDLSLLPGVTVDRKISVTGYHPSTTVGGGELVGVELARHDGVLYFDPNRAAEIGTAAYYVDSGSDAACWLRVGEGQLTSAQAGASTSLADNTIVFDGGPISGNQVFIEPGEYQIDKAFAAFTVGKVVGLADVVLNKSNTGAAAYVTWKSNVTYENITIKSSLADVPQIRTVVESNSIIKKCNVFDNTHVAAEADAWGFYFKNCYGASLYDCGASGNTQSDFTFVDDVKNVRIINGTDGGHGLGCKLNIEPNIAGAGGVESVGILGGSYSLITVIEPYTVGFAINGVKFDSVDIGTFSYSGGEVRLSNCNINILEGLVADPDPAIATGRAGKLSSDTLHLGGNLITDPKMFDISRDDTNSFWQVTASSIPPTDRYTRVSGETGIFTRLNPLETNGTFLIGNRQTISAAMGDKFALILSCRKKQNTLQPTIITIDFYDSGATLIASRNFWFNKSDVIGTTDITTETGIFECPANTAGLRVNVGSETNVTNRIDVFGIGLFRLLSTGVKGGTLDSRIEEVETANKAPMLQDHFPQSTAGYYYPNSFVGDRVINSAPIAGGASEWRCVTAGTPGVWKSLTLDP